jgi:hypothetical protein
MTFAIGRPAASVALSLSSLVLMTVLAEIGRSRMKEAAN